MNPLFFRPMAGVHRKRERELDEADEAREAEQERPPVFIDEHQAFLNRVRQIKERAAKARRHMKGW